MENLIKILSNTFSKGRESIYNDVQNKILGKDIESMERDLEPLEKLLLCSLYFELMIV